jgi:lysyl-tRNA synthetase, class II
VTRAGAAAYPNDFSRTHFAGQLHTLHAGHGPEALDKLQVTATIAGRLLSRQEAEEETLAVLQDTSGEIEISVSDAASGRASHAALRQWDLGDIVGVMGILYRTSRGALVLRAHELRLLVKSLRPVPDQRALRRFIPLRSSVLAGIREFMRGTQYMEVETPLLQPAADRSTPTPALETYHNALDLKLYLRSAAATYLQRLLIGGIEQVYEINRSFRNGPPGQARAEATTMEIYCAYTNHHYMMSLLERLIAHAASRAGGEVSFAAPFPRVAFAQAAREAEPDELGKNLIAPTFVVDYPADAAPRARRKDQDAGVAEYFTLFAGGEIIAEGLSALNDPAAAAADDADFVRALQYGMPPASGARLEVDRLVALLTGEGDVQPC